MALVDVEALLAPVAGDDPVGADMDGTPERYAIEEPFQLDQAEAGEGDDALEIDWRGTIRRIVEQLGQTKDLWLATYLMRAGAKLGDLDNVVGGAQLLAGLLERYWDTVHPQLDMVDFIGRKSPCEALTKIRDFLGPLRRTILLEHPRLGRFSGEDFERFAAETDAAEGYGMFRAALDDASGEGVQSAIDRLDSIRDAIRRSDAVLTAHAAGDTSTNFQPTYEIIEALRRSVVVFAGLDGGTEPAPAPSGDSGGESATSGGAQPSSTGPRIGGRVESRDDVIKALDAIGDYYRLREPSSPVPALLRRARNWVNLDFMAVLEDLAPDSLSDARKVLGVKSDESGGGGY